MSEVQYDFEGRRNKKIGEERFPGHNGVVQCVYDDTSTFFELDGTGAPIAKYDYGSDRLISLTRADEGRRYFSLDGLRSVVNLTNDDGLPVASYHLDPWGNFRFPTELNESKNRFAFTGHIYDTETGLYNAKARYFDPKLGRFLTQDSFLGKIDSPPSLHRYLYGYANPTRFVDPSGHSPVVGKMMELGAKVEQFTKKVDQAEEWVDKNIGQTLPDLGPNLLSVAKGKAIAATRQFARAQIYTRVSIQKLKAIHDATHPGAKPRPAAARAADVETEAERAALLQALEAEADEDQD